MDLFEGERLDFSKEMLGPVSASHDFINEKYSRGEVRIVTEQARYPLSTIVTMLDSGDYDLNPEFQRRHRWSPLKQSRLIESFIMNVPIPPIFLYEVSYSRYEVMDGLQRLTAISEFYRDGYTLVGLDQWPELNGMKYSQLPEQVRRGIDRRYLSSIILLQETAQSPGEAERMKQLVFERINSGGEKLEPQESRNALYNGPLNRLCIELARTDSFCRMWSIPTDTDLRENGEQLVLDFEGDEPAEQSQNPLLRNSLYQKMQDVELVLRFFAYRQLAAVEQGRLRDYLDEYLRKGNRFDELVLARLRDLFVATSDLVYAVLGETAFYLYRQRSNAEDGWTWFERPTKVLYDPLMHAFSNHIGEREVLVGQAVAIRAALKKLYEDKADTFKGRSTNQEDIRARNDLFTEFIEGFLEA